jgi:hypothetical protein
LVFLLLDDLLVDSRLLELLTCEHTELPLNRIMRQELIVDVLVVVEVL